MPCPNPSLTPINLSNSASPSPWERYRIRCHLCGHHTFRALGNIHGSVYCANLDCRHELLKCRDCEDGWRMEKRKWVCWACEKVNRGMEVRCFKCGYARKEEESEGGGCVWVWKKG